MRPNYNTNLNTTFNANIHANSNNGQNRDFSELEGVLKRISKTITEPNLDYLKKINLKELIIYQV